MRKLFIAGNWKMNTDSKSGEALAKGLANAIEASVYDSIDVAVCPPFVYLQGVANALAGSKISLGAQNVYFEDNGAFTGEVSCAMLKDVCCEYVILGHSERREYFGETDAILAKKVDAALANKMEIIFCFGEVLEDRKSNKHFDIVESQIRNGLFHLEASAWDSIILAYEPV